MLRSITDLNIHHLRNISSAELHFHPKCNFFYGENGSGKTTLLEALYILSSGRSFRTREISPLVSYGKDALTVFARTSSNETISIQKRASGPTQVKLNRQSCFTSSELAHFLPSQIFYQDIFQIIDAGPSDRRALLDWGLFHVEPSYHDVWKSYRLVIKQRNALLRQKAPLQQFVPWNTQLVNLAHQLDEMRSRYFAEWSSLFQSLLKQLTDVPCQLRYYKGWDKRNTGKPLDALLVEQFATDLQRQYTHAGPHQAEIYFNTDFHKAQRTLSRGQQKIVLIALKLAQATFSSLNCIYLFDDIAAELDSRHLSRLIRCLTTLNGQLFVTAIDDKTLSFFQDSFDSNTYCVEKGAIRQVNVSRETL